MNSSQYINVVFTVSDLVFSIFLLYICLFILSMLRCFGRRRRPPKHPNRPSIDTDRYLKYDKIRWWFPCTNCGTYTTNDLSYLIVLRKDVDQITSPMCMRCIHSFKVNKSFKEINNIQYVPHINIRLVHLK